MASDKEIIVVNATTGEVYERKPRKIKRTEAFYMTYQKDAIQLAKMNLTGTEHNIIRYLEGIADFDNVASVSQTFLAQEIGATEATISVSIKHLVELGIIRKEKICGRQVFIISQNVSTRGKIKA